MESVDSGDGGDMLDLFDLDNDNDIDFETAYKMISNFDVAASGENEELLPKLGFEDFTEFEPKFGLDGSSNNGRDDQYRHVLEGDQQQQPQHGQWQHAQPQFQEHSQTQLQHYEQQHNSSLRQQLSDSQEQNTDHAVSCGSISSQYLQYETTSTTDSRPQLLSAYESNAIEHFLDSLISQSHAREKEEQEPFKRDASPYNATCKPPTVEIPEITIADSDIPVEIRNDSGKVKKWKHVEIERIRRNQIKKTFDQLIGMTRYPRGHGCNKIVKPSGDKRVPKHTLLNYIVEDIRSILQANEKLEAVLKDIKNIKKEDFSI